MSDLQAHIATEEAELRGTAAVTTPVVEAKPAETHVEPEKPTEAAVTETPEQEAESLKPDTELSDAAKTLRRNRADERKKKIQRDIDELTAIKYREQQDVDRLRRERDALSRGEEPRRTAPATAASVADPNDPEPQETAFEDYGKYLAEHARWAARDEFRKQQEAHRARVARAESETRAQTYARTLDEQQAKLRDEFSDADAVIETVITSLADNPRAAAVSEFLANSEVGGKVAYRLGKDAAALKAVSEAASPYAVARELARLEQQILAPKPAPKHVTTAPPPPSQSVGAGASAASIDTTKPGTSLKDHIRQEEAEIAERRRAGYRY